MTSGRRDGGRGRLGLPHPFPVPARGALCRHVTPSRLPSGSPPAGARASAPVNRLPSAPATPCPELGGGGAPAEDWRGCRPPLSGKTAPRISRLGTTSTEDEMKRRARPSAVLWRIIGTGCPGRRWSHRPWWWRVDVALRDWLRALAGVGRHLDWVVFKVSPDVMIVWSEYTCRAAI